MLQVTFLSEDDALEIIQPIEAFPPRMSKLASMKLRPCSVSRGVRGYGRRCPGQRRGTLKEAVEDENDRMDEDPEEKSGSVSSAIARELEHAQLEEREDVPAGSDFFSFQRVKRARSKQATRGRGAARMKRKLADRETEAENIDSSVSAKCSRSAKLPKVPATSNSPVKSKVANEAVTASPRTPRTSKRETPRTPQTKSTNTPKATRSSVGVSCRSKILREAEQTPRALRRRVQLRLAKLSQDDLAVSDDGDSDSSEFVPSESGSDPDSGEMSDDCTAATPPPSCATITTRGEVSQRASVRECHSTGQVGFDEYFEQQSGRQVTSDRTLSRLNQPRLNEQALTRLSAGGCNQEVKRHASGRLLLLQHVHALFDKWLLLLSRGFSVVLYGLGSKRPVLERFRLDRLSDHMHMVVNGFFPNLTARALLRALVTEVLEADCIANSQSLLEFVCSRFQSGSRLRLFLLVASLDGPALRSEKMQQLLCRLAKCPQVHLIGSVDHVNAPLIWNQNMMASLNATWFDASTFAPYAEETSYENSLLVQNTGALALSSLRHVFQSLTTNARGVFLLLAKEQVAHASDSAYDGMSVSGLYRRCRDRFLVSSMVALRCQLTEFRDHKLVASRRAADGSEHLLVQLERQLLQEFISWCEQI